MRDPQLRRRVVLRGEPVLGGDLSGRPDRGASPKPASARWAYARRHLITVGSDTPTGDPDPRAALGGEQHDPRRFASRAWPVCDRTRRSNSARSAIGTDNRFT